MGVSLGMKPMLLAALLFLGLAARIGFCILCRGDIAYDAWDGREYHGYALSILSGQGDVYVHFLNCIRSPGYPLFLVPFVAFSATALWPIQLAQVVLGIFQAFLLAHIVARWAGLTAGQWTLAIALLHPILIWPTAFIMTETLFITLLFGAIACMQRAFDGPRQRQVLFVALGAALLGFGCLVRPALQLFLPVVAVCLAWQRWREGRWPAAFGQVVCLTALCALFIVPWCLRNLKVHGEFTLAPRNTALVSAEANSMEYFRMFQAKTKEEYYATYDVLIQRINRGADSSPERLVASAREFRTQHAAEWRLLQWYKFRHFWTPWVNPLIFSRMNFYLSLLTFTPMFILGAFELYRRRKKIDPFLILLVGVIATGYVVGGLLFHSAVRYRIPFVDVACLLLTGSWLGNVAPFAAWGRKILAANSPRPGVDADLTAPILQPSAE